MNKRLETLLQRIPTWPQEAQDDAVMALSDIEEKIRILRSLSPEDQAKLAALRADINRAIERAAASPMRKSPPIYRAAPADAEREKN